MVLMTSILFSGYTLFGFRHASQLPTNCLVDEVKVCFEQDYCPQFINSVTIGFLQESTINSSIPRLIWIARSQWDGQKCSFHFSQLVILSQRLTMAEVKYNSSLRFRFLGFLPSLLIVLFGYADWYILVLIDTLKFR